jgi:anti-sigma factor RsiW
VTCAEQLTTQAYFDGEIDAAAAAGVERHIAQCADCRALLDDLQQCRAAIRNMPQPGAPPALRARILSSIDDEAVAEAVAEKSRSGPLPGRSRPWHSRPFWFGAFGGAGAAMAAMLAWITLAPAIGNPLLDDLMTAHVRSLMPAHLIDVASTDQHTVKPWFAGHADVSPMVVDFAPQGYRLVGGRADYFAHQRSAVVVYQHGPHVINVFSWAGNGRQVPADTTRNGYRMMFWQVGDLDYCAVSDTGWDELGGLVRLLQQSSARDSRNSN